MAGAERDYRESCLANGERWKPLKERAVEKKAKVLTLSEAGATVIDQGIPHLALMRA